MFLLLNKFSFLLLFSWLLWSNVLYFIVTSPQLPSPPLFLLTSPHLFSSLISQSLPSSATPLLSSSPLFSSHLSAHSPYRYVALRELLVAHLGYEILYSYASTSPPADTNVLSGSQKQDNSGVWFQMPWFLFLVEIFDEVKMRFFS